MPFMKKAASFVPIPTVGLEAHYPFNGNANDESGNGHNGVPSNATLISDRHGVPNSAYSFITANSSRIDISNPISIDMTSPHTISYWINLNSSATSVNSILSLTSQPANNEYFVFAFNNVAYEIITYGNTSTLKERILGTFSELQNQWLSIIHVFNGTSYSVYINDILRTTSGTGGLVAGATSKSTIGSSNGNTQYFWGLIDDIRIYNVAVTRDEVTALANE